MTQIFRVLNLSYNRISKVEHIEGSCAIEELHLASNNIKEMKGFSNLKCIKVLELGFNKIEVRFYVFAINIYCIFSKFLFLKISLVLKNFG